MKRIFLNTKTYIGPFGCENIDFYSIYKNQLYIISEHKFKYLLDYLHINYPEKIKLGFDISAWLYKKNLLNENLLSEISSKILNVPKDFSESDVYYYLNNKEDRKNILCLFEDSLKNAYIYYVLNSNKKVFIDIFTKFLKYNEQNFCITEIIKNFYSFLFSTGSNIISVQVKKFKLPLIVLKDKFFFERICKCKNVVYNNAIFKQYFFPKRYNLEFLLENEADVDLDKILKTMYEINNKRIDFELKVFKKKFFREETKFFQICKKTNFSFINFEMIIFLSLFSDEKFYINNQLLNYFTNTQFRFIVNNKSFLEPINYGKIKIKTF